MNNQPRMGSHLYLKEMDAAIVLKSDGTLEASLPEITTDHVPDHILTGAALIFALQDPHMRQMIYENFAKACAQPDAVNTSTGS